MRQRLVVVVLFVVAGCKGKSATKPAVDENACNPPGTSTRPDGKVLPEGIEDVFAIGDTPRSTFTQLEGHRAGECTFDEGPSLAKQADGSLVVTAEGAITGTCGSAKSRFLARKVVKVVGSTGSTISGLGLLTGPVELEIGERPRSLYAVRLDACDRELRSHGPSRTRWRLGSCNKLVEPGADGFTKPAEQVELKGVAAGTCELELEAGGATGKVSINVTGEVVPAGIDPCAFSTPEKIETAIGPLADTPTKTPPTGTGLGGCKFELVNRQVTVEARPVAEFDATAAGDKKGKALPGVGEKAIASETFGVIVKIAGKPYFLHVQALAGGAHDNQTETALAKLLAAGAK